MKKGQNQKVRNGINLYYVYVRFYVGLDDLNGELSNSPTAGKLAAEQVLTRVAVMAGSLQLPSPLTEACFTPSFPCLAGQRSSRVISLSTKSSLGFWQPFGKAERGLSE
jgi:hypothetical protein